MLADIAALRSGDAARIRVVLAREAPLDAALIPHVIALLGDRAVVRDAVRALRRAAPNATGQLIDALLQQDLASAVRRRVPRVLEACATSRAVEGLMLGLGEPSFELRRQCALALLALTEQHPALLPAKDAVLAAAARELELADQVAESGAPPQRDGLRQVFAVLSLALEREPLNIAFRALSAEDRGARGTALEYLEVVLPPAIRAAIWPRIIKA